MPPLDPPEPPVGLERTQSRYDLKRQLRQMRLVTDRALIVRYDGAETFPAEQLAHEKRLLLALIYFFAARSPRVEQVQVWLQRRFRERHLGQRRAEMGQMPEPASLPHRRRTSGSRKS